MASVLIIDDEQAITSALGMYFERSGHEVMRAHSGEEGIGAVRRSHPDLVLLDIRLPDLNGFEVLDRLREQNPVVIMITGHGDVPAMFVSLPNAPRLVRRSRFFSMCTETRPRSAGSK